MHIVLHQPEIPQNTGNIGRTCVATGTSLHLIEPLGFRLGEKDLKRAGMDYWQHLDVTRYVDYQDFLEKHPGAKIWMATTKAKKCYTDVQFGMDDFRVEFYSKLRRGNLNIPRRKAHMSARSKRFFRHSNPGFQVFLNQKIQECCK